MFRRELQFLIDAYRGNFCGYGEGFLLDFVVSMVALLVENVLVTKQRGTEKGSLVVYGTYSSIFSFVGFVLAFLFFTTCTPAPVPAPASQRLFFEGFLCSAAGLPVTSGLCFFIAYID